MSYVDQAALATNPGFLNQLRVAVATAAVNVAGEATTGHDSTQYQKRQQLATQVLSNLEGSLARFTWPVVENLALTLGAPVSISSSTNANPIVITAGSAHGYSTGACVYISNHAVNTPANGAFTITVLTTTTLSIPAMGIGAGTATGQIVKLPLDSDIQFQVNAVWDHLAGISATD